MMQRRCSCFHKGPVALSHRERGSWPRNRAGVEDSQGRAGVLYLWPHRVLYPNHSDAGQVRQDLILAVPVRLSVSREVTESQADGPQPMAGHGLYHLLHHLIPVLHLEHPGVTILVQDPGAPNRTGMEGEGDQQ